MNVGLQATVREAPAVAVVGVSALFPGSGTTAGFWRDILEGRDRLTEVPRTHWLPADYFDPRPRTADKVYTTRGGFLSEVEFSPLEFGLPPNTLPATDTAQLLALVVAKRVLIEATRGKFESMDRSRMSVVLGVASATELVAQMVGRLQMPVVGRAMRAAGLAGDEVARVQQILRPATRRGRRAPSRACSATWSPAASPIGSISEAPTWLLTRPVPAHSRPLTSR